MLVLLLSGIALATSYDSVVKTFRPGDTLGGSGWSDWDPAYGEGDYNGVAKTKCTCLILHKQIFLMMKERQYGQLLRIYLMDGLLECDWNDLTPTQQLGLASILDAKDQKALLHDGEDHGLDVTLDLTHQQPSSRTGDQQVFRKVDVAHEHKIHTSTSVPKDSTDTSKEGFPSQHLCAAAHFYGRKLLGGDTWRMLAELHGHTWPVTCLALDYKCRLVSGSSDKTLRVWDLQKVLGLISTAPGAYNEFSGEKVKSVTLAVIDSHERNPDGHSLMITDVKVNSAGTVAVSTSHDATLRVWSLREQDLGHNLQIIHCTAQLKSETISNLRLERLCITSNAEFAFVCGPSGIFQGWRLIDGVKLPGIKWGGLIDMPDELLGDRLTDFEAVSLSRGASQVATCRHADILLWDSETFGGITRVSGQVNAKQWHAEQADAELAVNELQMTQIKEAHKISRTTVKADADSTTEMKETSSHDIIVNSPSVPMPTGKVITLPGSLKERVSADEEASAREYFDLKMQFKGIIRGAKETILASKKSLEGKSTSFKKRSESQTTKSNQTKKIKFGWISSDLLADQPICTEEIDDGAVRAHVSEEHPSLLVFHSETLQHGKYTWTLTVEERRSNFVMRMGVISRKSAGLPYTFDAEDPDDGEHWSWYLESDDDGSMLTKGRLVKEGESALVESTEKFEKTSEEVDGFSFGEPGDILTVTLECRSGSLSFEAKRGDETFNCCFGDDSALSRIQGINQAKETPGQTEASLGHVQDGRQLFAFVEFVGEPGNAAVVGNITHESKIPSDIRRFFTNLSDGMLNSKIVRPVADTEISYKGGTIEINCRCGGPKQLDDCGSSVVLHWPRSALPGPTKMEIRVCPAPADSEMSCEARYTAGIDKSTSGRVVGVVVDLRPHGLVFQVPITIRIPHALVIDAGEAWQKELEALHLDDFQPVMGVPNCLFTCFDGNFDSRYGLLTVKSSGIYGLKASNCCRDLIHAKLYCKPGPTFLDARHREQAQLDDDKKTQIDTSMHEITSQNLPEVFISEKKAVPMRMKVCGVFCQDENLKEVLKTPCYYIPYRARIMTLSVQLKGYALGVNIELGKINLHEPNTASSDDDQDRTDLFVNTIYLGGPLVWDFALKATAANGVSNSLLELPEYQSQNLELSLKLRGTVSSQFDNPSDARLKQIVTQKRLQQYVSVAPFPVIVRAIPPKARFQQGVFHVLQLLKSTEDREQVETGHLSSLSPLSSLDCAHSAHCADLFIMRNPAAASETRSEEDHILDQLKKEGWSFLDLSALIHDGIEVENIRYVEGAGNCKATLVFLEEMMLQDHLDHELPLYKMWVAVLKAHGMCHGLDGGKRHGGDRIIPISVPVSGGFPKDTRAWKGLIGERLESYAHNHIAVEYPNAIRKVHEWLLENIKLGQHGTERERLSFFRGSASMSEQVKVPAVKYVCHRVLATARELALDGQVDLEMSVRHYFARYSAEAQDFWMSLENEFALEMRQEDIERVQTFYGVVRMVHCQICKAAGSVSCIRDARPLPNWLEMD